jgi:D-alanyl-lipoteichoic acid acyltransferase DltB (MBOAT superfamily)
MRLEHILVFCAFALPVGLLLPRRWRGWLVFAVSVVAIYWLQPASTIRHLGFWLPTATLALTAFSWALTTPSETRDLKDTLLSGSALAVIILLVAAVRYVPLPCCLPPTRPPQITQVLFAVAVVAGLAALTARFFAKRRWLGGGFFAFVLFLFVILKTEPLGTMASAWLRSRTGQSVELASAIDIGWLGFSYVAFRLLHTLRDSVQGRLPALSLREYFTYVIFFPAITAGPIDRAERFVKGLREAKPLLADDVMVAGRRILVGVFKKFVLADSLALIALNASKAAQVQSSGWMWLLLYAYAFNIYLDFSGYTDVAIGLGRLLGITLPENFDRPYIKPNLTAFWNSWHMTLAQWFRSYFFNPLTRSLRSGRRVPVAVIILVGQLSTMVLIGLWHGMTWNFLIWGAWHGVGLYIHNRWYEWRRTRPPRPDRPVWLQRAGQVGATLLTFHFVVLGWAWFALPSPSLALQVLGKLFGI